MIHLLSDTYIHKDDAQEFNVDIFQLGDIVISQYTKIWCVYWCEIEEKKYLGGVHNSWYSIEEFLLSGHTHPEQDRFKFCKVVPDINQNKSVFINDNMEILGEVNFLVYEPQEFRDVEYSWVSLGTGQSKSGW
jgi:hypothetical protein